VAVDGEDGNAVVPAIGGEEEFAVGMYVDFSGVVVAGEGFGKCRDSLQLMQQRAV